MSLDNVLSGIMQITAQVKGELCEFALSANDDAKLVLGLGNARRELPIKVAQINVGDTINYNDTDAQVLSIVPRKPVVHPADGIMVLNGNEPEGAPAPIEHLPPEAYEQNEKAPEAPVEAVPTPEPLAHQKEALQKIDGLLGRLQGTAPADEMSQKLAGLQEKLKQVPAAMSMIANALLSNDAFVDSLLNRLEVRRAYLMRFNQRVVEERLRRAKVDVSLVESAEATFAAYANPEDHISDPGKLTYYVKVQVESADHDEHGNHVLVNKWAEIKNIDILPASTAAAIEAAAFPTGKKIFISVLTVDDETAQTIIDDIRQEMENESSEQPHGDGGQAVA